MKLRRILPGLLIGLTAIGCAHPPSVAPAETAPEPGGPSVPVAVPRPERDARATGVPAEWTTAPVGLARSTAEPSAAPRLVELRVDGMVRELSVAPGGALWLTTDTGHAYRSDGFGEPWSPATLDCVGADGRRAACGRVTFFTDRAAIATGYIGRHSDEYYVTGDAGRTWERRSFGGPEHADGQWIYTVFATDRGEAWMGGSHGLLLHSADFGRTWSRRAAPYDHSRRLARIFMAGPRGLAGALANQLQRTEDGGRTWTAIETPVDQRATTGAVRETYGGNPIENVALVGEWLLVQQNRRVYASPRAAVRWRPLAGLVTFATDRGGRHVFAMNRDRSVVTLDAELKPTKIRGARIRSHELDLHVEGDTLYVLDESHGLYRIDAAGARFTALMTQGDGPQSIASVRRAGDRLWGISPHGIYASEDGGARWRLRLAGERSWIGLAVRDPDTLLVWDDAGAAEQFDVRTDRLRPIPGLAGVQVHAVVARGDRWLALGAGRRRGETWLSSDRGAAWSLLDHWTGSFPRAVYPLADGRTFLWTSDLHLRLLPAAPSARTQVHDTPSAPGELMGPIALFFADPHHGFLRVSIHNLGAHAWATVDGGATWERIEPEAFPYTLVVPYRDGALALDGDPRSGEKDPLRELHFLQGDARTLVHHADVEISDVSVDPAGRILLELDPEPESYEDSSGKRWVELRPYG